MIWNGMASLRSKLFQRAMQSCIRNISNSQALRKDHYETLGLKKDATQADIKNAYFELSKVYHPDRIAATDENLAKFREITAAYEILGNESSRRLYDRGLLGDVKRIDDVEDQNDPIIKFYKQRRDRSKIPTVGKPEEMDNWTEQFYKTTRKAAFTKNELFKETKGKVLAEESVSRKNLVLVVVGIAISLIFSAQLENHYVRNNIQKFLSTK